MSRLAAAMRLTGVGFFIAACILGGTFGGRWLDDKLATGGPWLMIGGLLLGVAVAFYGVFQMVRPLMNNRQNRKNG